MTEATIGVVARMQAHMDGLLGKPYKRFLQQPVRHNGWLVLTDGHALMMIESDEVAPEHSAEVAAEGPGTSFPLVCDSVIHATLSDARFSTQLLRDLAGVRLDLPPCSLCKQGFIVCPKCKGDGGKDCECVECGNGHQVECKSCSGLGTWKCKCGRSTEKHEPIAINTFVMNAPLLANWLQIVDADAFAYVLQDTSSDLKQVVLGGDGWRLCLMGYRAKLEECVRRLYLTVENPAVTA